MTQFSKRTSLWGLASLVLLIGQFVVDGYNGYLLHNRRAPLLSNTAALEWCAVVQLGAAACGVIAIRRGGSRWWSMTVLLSTLLALSCYFGEL